MIELVMEVMEMLVCMVVFVVVMLVVNVWVIVEKLMIFVVGECNAVMFVVYGLICCSFVVFRCCSFGMLLVCLCCFSLLSFGSLDLFSAMMSLL